MLGVKYGLIAGMITVMAYLVTYFISMEAFLSPILYWATMSIYIGAMYLLANVVVEQGERHFREIVRPLFICYLVANAVYFIFYYVMITYVNPEIYTSQTQAMMERLTKLELEKTDLSFKLSDYLLHYFQSAIGGFIIAASIAFSKKQS